MTIRLRPTERLQIAGLLGALGHGLSGSDALSIFGDVTSEISARQEQEAKRRAAMMSAQQDLLDAHNKGLGTLTDFLLKEQPSDRTTTTTDAQGNVSTVHSTTDQIPFSELEAQLGALGQGIPGGLSTPEASAIGNLADQMYQLPGLGGSYTDDKGAPVSASPGQALSHLLGTPGAPVVQLPEFWRGLRGAVDQGIAKKRAPKEILSAILDRAAGLGFGSKDEQQQVASTVGQLLASRGYPATPRRQGDVAAATSEPSGDGGALSHFLDPLLGALGVAGAVKGVQKLRGARDPLGALAGPIKDYAGGPRGAAAPPPPVVPAGENPYYTRPEGHVPLGLPAGSGQPALGPGEPAVTPQMLGEGPPLTPRMLGEGQPLENVFPGARGGPLEGPGGVLGAIGLPLQAIDMWAQQRNQANLSDTWYSWTDAQRRQYMVDHPEAFDPNDQLQPDGTIITPKGEYVDPVGKRVVGLAG